MTKVGHFEWQTLAVESATGFSGSSSDDVFASKFIYDQNKPVFGLKLPVHVVVLYCMSLITMPELFSDKQTKNLHLIPVSVRNTYTHTHTHARTLN